MKKISLSKSKKNGDNKKNLLHGVQDSILVGSREQGGGISSLKLIHFDVYIALRFREFFCDLKS